MNTPAFAPSACAAPSSLSSSVALCSTTALTQRHGFHGTSVRAVPSRRAAAIVSPVLPAPGNEEELGGALDIEAMRHRKKIPKLNKAADQRKALLRALTTELIRHGRIKTTWARAQAVRKTADHMITLAKDGSLHSRRQALGYIYDKQLVHALFDQVPDRYGERNGGYTRVLHTMPRKGDNAPMGIIELV